jgi:hypothetical protein
MMSFIKIHRIEGYRKIGLYRCGCGNLMTTRKSSVDCGYTKSCGCLRVENIKKINRRRNERNAKKHERAV